MRLHLVVSTDQVYPMSHANDKYHIEYVIADVNERYDDLFLFKSGFPLQNVYEAFT